MIHSCLLVSSAQSNNEMYEEEKKWINKSANNIDQWINKHIAGNLINSILIKIANEFSL